MTTRPSSFLASMVRQSLLFVALVVVFLVAVVVLADQTRTFYTPTIVGVVEGQHEIQDGSQRVTRLTLVDGRTIDVDTMTRRIVYGGLLPLEGELLLAGDEPDAWIARLPGRDPCFEIGGRGTEQGDFIATAVGLRLPKAAVFDRRHYHETEHEFNGAGFCVNALGEVTGIR